MSGARVVALGRLVPARAGGASSGTFGSRQRDVTPAADQSTPPSPLPCGCERGGVGGGVGAGTGPDPSMAGCAGAAGAV